MGPTASGKSSLAERLASLRGGELVNADASALFCPLQVGVTKPDAATRRQVTYHLLDCIDLEQAPSMGEYQRWAREVIDDLGARHRLAVVVGGSNLYLRALLDGYCPPDIAVPSQTRDWVRSLNPQAALSLLEAHDPASLARLDRKNPRRVSRALELTLALGGPVPPPHREPVPGWSIVRLILLPEKDILARRIRQRTEAMWDAWREEVLQLEQKGLAYWLEVRKPIGYTTVLAHLRGEISEGEAIEEIVRQTLLLAKKQRTWLQKETAGPDRHVWVLRTDADWESLEDQAVRVVDGFLARFAKGR